MFLKRLEIYGFKSFAGRTVLDFEYNKSGNITAIVGPNGSGKSNVADAIRWVTGEQSTKNLRSKKSEDVIFCGSAARQRGSYAEVSIILADTEAFTFELNNKTHTLTEIEVSRKLYRSGESEYLLNHKKVRLTDIQQLLASLGFGQSSYTVIGQGMVDRLLSFTAAERKVLFDEAAGVKQYEIKREQALRKLESTDTNLIRLRDILLELTPRVANLRRLVKRSEGRKEFENELLAVQQTYFGSLLSEYRDAINEAEIKKSDLNKKIVQIDQRLIDLQKHIENKRDNPKTTERRVLESEISAITAERDKLMREVSYLKGQLEAIDRNRTYFEPKSAELKTEKTTLTEKISFLKEKIAHERTSLDEITKQKDALAEPVTTLTQKISQLEREIREPADDKTNRIHDLKNRIDELTKNKLTAETAATRLIELEELQKRLIAEITDARMSQEKVQSETDKQQRELEALESEISKLASMINPETLAGLEAAMVEIENTPSSAKNFADRLNKLFVQFRKLAKAINNNEREKLDREISVLKQSAKETAETLVSWRVLLGTKESQLAQIKQEIDLNRQKTTHQGVEKDSIDELQKELAKYEGGLNERQNVLLRQKDTLQSELTSARESLHQADMEYSRLSSLVQNQDNELASAERRLHEVLNTLANLEHRKAEPGDAELSERLQTNEKHLNKLEEDLAKQRGWLTQIIAAERELEQAGLEYEREKRTLQDEKSALLTQISAVEVESAKTQVRLEDLNEEIRATRVIINLDHKYGYLDQMEKDVLRTKMENLRRKLEQIGGVDPETEAEYLELDQREKEMSAQVEDLTKAKADLEKVVRELDERIKSQFSSVFANISKEFSAYFSTLFSGGNAALELGADEEGNFGIGITANPPGKRIQSLNALSGGERTLTSLALLFAILSVNPSPFCVLDEVDAALDESNTLRFVKILAELAKKTQFIIISHNRDTMKAAGTLYGVTMNDEHVSKLLSVHLTEALVTAKQ